MEINKLQDVSFIAQQRKTSECCASRFVLLMAKALKLRGDSCNSQNSAEVRNFCRMRCCKGIFFPLKAKQYPIQDKQKVGNSLIVVYKSQEKSVLELITELHSFTEEMCN